MPDLQPPASRFPPPVSSLQLQLDRILVVVPNWFGEALFATPFLRALRRQQPTARIMVLGWSQANEVLRGNPHVDALIDYEERGGLAGKWRLMRRLRAQQCDASFILRKSLSRSLLLALAGIPVRIGFDNPKSGWLLTRRVAVSGAAVHKAASYLPLLAAVGLRPENGPYEYAVSDAEREEARRLLVAHRVDAARPAVVLHPGANWPHKRWLPERFAALGDRLIAQRGAQVWLTGGPDDRPLAESIARHMQQPAVILAGETTLRQLAACLESAAAVVSNDTGVLHIAAALRRPVVALYGPTSPALTGPMGESSRIAVIHHAGSCPSIPCYSPDRPPHPGMATISVEEAYAAVSQLLEKTR